MTPQKRRVYLAGPITGLTYDRARYSWRTIFSDILNVGGFDHIECYSPMRAKDILKDFGVLTAGKGYPEDAMTSPSGITTRDRSDLKNSDAMVACFLDSQDRLSGGTFIEYGWADAWRIPIIGIGFRDDPNLAHLMARDIIGYRVDTLEEGAAILGALLTPGL